MKKLRIIGLFIICTNVLYAQKQKTLFVNAVSDFPISKKLSFNYGVGAEVSLLIDKQNVKNLMFAFSVLQYQSYYYGLPLLSGEQVRFSRNELFYRLTIGKLFKASNKLFFNGQVGFGIGDAIRPQISQIQPTFLLGPAVILPIQEKYFVKLHAAFGTIGEAVFVNIGAAFGFKF
jgi:hypothetical protein